MISDEADLSTLTPSGEWKVMDMPAVRKEVKFECCPNDPPYKIGAKSQSSSILFTVTDIFVKLLYDPYDRVDPDRPAPTSHVLVSFKNYCHNFSTKFGK